jgi:NAD(P)-dependent dehydrogenase (short-subunit alcohol dehydrogenase family)
VNLGLEGRVAVVTGASRGIGAATAKLLAQEGARVVAVSRGESGIDVTAPDAAERIAALAGAPVDILVNNAGTSFVRPLDELTDDDWRAQHELHVMAPLRLMRAFAPGMAERGWGRIVNVTSSAAKRPSLTNAAYSVSKSAQQALSRVFADAYAGTGVLVNSLAPGAVATELWFGEGGMADQMGGRDTALERQQAKIPIGRFGEPEEIAAVIAFLCSEQASNVTGAAWSADGGTVPVVI